MADGDRPDYVQIPPDLKGRFSELQGISDIVLGLAGKIDLINQLNTSAAGTDDATAKAYHSQIGPPTQDITTLVQEVGNMFGVKADDGSAAADVLNYSGESADDVADADWDPQS